MSQDKKRSGRAEKTNAANNNSNKKRVHADTREEGKSKKQKGEDIVSKWDGLCSETLARVKKQKEVEQLEYCDRTGACIDVCGCYDCERARDVRFPVISAAEEDEEGVICCNSGIPTSKCGCHECMMERKSLAQFKKPEIQYPSFCPDLSIQDQVKLVTDALKDRYPSKAGISYDITRLRGIFLKRNPDELAPYVNDSFNAFAGADLQVTCCLTGKGKALELKTKTVIELRNHNKAVRFVMDYLLKGYTLVYNPFITWNPMPPTPENFAAEFIRQSVKNRATF